MAAASLKLDDLHLFSVNMLNSVPDGPHVDPLQVQHFPEAGWLPGDSYLQLWDGKFVDSAEFRAT